MPRGDGTGPGGQGPMTGRAMGYCAGFPVPGYVNSGFGYGGRGGFGRGRGFGKGRGFGRAGLPGNAQFMGYQQNQSSGTDELSVLREQAQNLEATLKSIKERVSELNK